MTSAPDECIPTVVGGGRVLLYSRIDRRHRSRHANQQTRYGVAICAQPNGSGVFLFTCEEGWNPVFDTSHPSVLEAKRQAELEWEGLDVTWEEPPR